MEKLLVLRLERGRSVDQTNKNKRNRHWRLREWGRGVEQSSLEGLERELGAVGGASSVTPPVYHHHPTTPRHKPLL